VTSEDRQIPDPQGMEVLHFDIISENWNEYELEDGTNLRSRLVLTRVMRPKQGYKPGEFGLSLKHVFNIVASPEKRGKPGPPLTPDEIVVKPDDISSGVKIPAKVISSSEQWDVYRVHETGDMFRIKMFVTEVYRVRDRFDQFGEPQYVVAWGQVVAPVAKGYEKIDLTGKSEGRKS
jgi:hypothetical protein